MALPKITSYDEWRAARVELLAEEKALTRARDALNTQRRELPMVRVDKDYRFDGPSGPVGLVDLFGGRPQLIVQHFMFDPAWDDGCPSCTSGVDELADGLVDHLQKRNTTYVLVSRAPIDKIENYRQRRGWTLPWYSSFGSDFNYDFHVSLDPVIAPVEYNFRDADELERSGAGWMNEGTWEQPGYSAFLHTADGVFHTYSMYARGAEWSGGSYAFLDLTPLGRQEDWEEPKGRSESVREAIPDFST
ncbi:MAG: DUF899 domain-containing protein [Acidimicrobiales bacterium]